MESEQADGRNSNDLRFGDGDLMYLWKPVGFQ